MPCPATRVTTIGEVLIKKTSKRWRISMVLYLIIQKATFHTEIPRDMSHRDITVPRRTVCLEILVSCNIDSMLARVFPYVWHETWNFRSHLMFHRIIRTCTHTPQGWQVAEDQTNELQLFDHNWVTLKPKRPPLFFLISQFWCQDTNANFGFCNWQN